MPTRSGRPYASLALPPVMRSRELSGSEARASLSSFTTSSRYSGCGSSEAHRTWPAGGYMATVLVTPDGHEVLTKLGHGPLAEDA